MPFASAPMNYTPPSASTVSSMAGSSGGMNNMFQNAIIQSLLSGGGQKQQEQNTLMQPDKKSIMPQVNADFKSSIFGDLIKRALLGDISFAGQEA